MYTKHNINTISHPCFSHIAHFTVARVHLPVAPRCNIKCNYCDRRVSDCIHAHRPGVSSEVLSPSNAIGYVDKLAPLIERGVFQVVGIAGPGEPIFNDETFKTFRLVRRRYPDLKLCVCTNGLLLPSKIEQLREVNLNYLTITINAVDPSIGERINSFANYEGVNYTGLKAAETLMHNQLLGLDLAVKSGFTVKINTVYVPGVNDNHIVEVAREIGRRGADLHNIMPLIPLGKFRNVARPTVSEMRAIQNECERYVPQFRLCKQCRADACGIPGIKDFILSDAKTSVKRRDMAKKFRSPSNAWQVHA